MAQMLVRYMFIKKYKFSLFNCLAFILAEVEKDHNCKTTLSL